VAYVRTVKTSSGAIAVQIVWSSRRGSRSIEHLGSARDEAELAALKAAAAERLAAGQAELDLGIAAQPGSVPLPITSSRAAHLWDALSHAYDVVGFDKAAGGEEVFRQLVLARIIEPTSKADSLRVLGEAGVAGPSYPTLNRRLPVFAKPGFRQALSKACAEQAALGPASLVLYDVSTLYFETDAGDGFREPGFSKERRLEPQITLGLLTDAAGFPLTVEAFEGNKIETDTMLPVINAFKAAHRLTEVTVVADAGMISEANQKAIVAAGLSFILGTRMPRVPQVVTEWRDKHPGQEIPDGHVFTQPWPATAAEKARGIPDRVIYYQYRHDRPGAPSAGSMSRSARPSGPWRARPRSNATGSSNCPGRPRASTATWSQSPCPGRAEGLHHQPDRRHCRVRHRRLPPAVAHREELPDVQTRSAGPPDLPPQA